MSSIVSSSGLMFCEGGPGSFDIRLYDKVTPAGWQVVPAGGKRGLVDFVRGALRSDEPTGRIWAGLRDRDFEYTPADTAQCIRRRDKWQVFTTHRTCVENYLIDPRVVHRYWSAMARQGVTRFGSAPDLAEMQAALRTVARTLAASQAFFWTMTALWKTYTKAPWQRQSLGALRERPGGLAGLDGRTLAVQLVEAVPATRPAMSRAEVEAIFDEYAQRFDAADFWARDHYLTWFDGKDLLDEARRTLKTWPLEKQDLNRLVDDQITVDDFPDLKALAAELARIPPYGTVTP